MTYPQSALPVWFGHGRANDSALLTAWKDAPLTYSPGQDLDYHWNVDRYEAILGNDPSGELFRHAARLVLHNRIYPLEVMTSVSDASLENRPVREGDRVLQRILFYQYNTLPILEFLTLNQITEVIDEPRRAGFSYTTTSVHSEVGEWSPQVIWRENGEVALVVEVISRTRPGILGFFQRRARRLQLRAHRLSIRNFRARLEGKSFAAPLPQPVSRRGSIAVGMLMVAFVLLLNTVFQRITEA